MFAPYCKPGNCFVSIKCTKATLPIVYIEFQSPDLIIPLKHLSNENAGSVEMRLITLSPFEVRNYNFEYEPKNIEDIDTIIDWKKIMLDLNHLDRIYRYRKFKYRKLGPYPIYNAMYLFQTTGKKIFPEDYVILRGTKMIEYAYNFFHGDTPEVILYSSTNFNNLLLDCGEDLKLEPARSRYFKKVKFYVDLFASEAGTIFLLVLISLSASFISLAISGYATYGDWKRNINLSPFGIVSPTLVFIVLMFKQFNPWKNWKEFFEVLIVSPLILLLALYLSNVSFGLLYGIIVPTVLTIAFLFKKFYPWKERKEFFEITAVSLFLLLLAFLYFGFFDNLALYFSLALQVYIMFKPDFICCFVSVIILIYHAVFAIIA